MEGTRPLDTLLHVETPEGVDLALPVAGPVARARAWLVDLAIKLGVGWVGLTVATLLGQAGVGIFMVLAFLLHWLYPVVFEVLRGATPGKRLVGLRVVHDDGTPVGWPAALIRSTVGFVDTLPAFYGVGLLSCLTAPGFKRLGDLAGGTLVVYVEQRRSGDGPAEGVPVPPPIPLRPEEQRAVVEFAERARFLTVERQQELAELAGVLTAGAADPVERLKAQARWVAGQR